jgi:hypothetical protein
MAGFYNRVGVSESAQGSRPVAFSTGVKTAVRRAQPASLPPVQNCIGNRCKPNSLPTK